MWWCPGIEDEDTGCPKSNTLSTQPLMRINPIVSAFRVTSRMILRYTVLEKETSEIDSTADSINVSKQDEKL